MDRELIRDYLKRSMFTEVQAEALSRVFADLTGTFATKTDLGELKSELKTEIGNLRTELKTGLSDMETRLTWRIIGAMAFLAALLQLLDRFAS